MPVRSINWTAHGKIVTFRVYHHTLAHSYTVIAFATALTLRVMISRWPIMQEVRRHTYCAPSAHRTTSSGSISIRHRLSVSSFPHGTILYRCKDVFSLEDGSPIFRQVCSRSTSWYSNAWMQYRALTFYGTLFMYHMLLTRDWSFQTIRCTPWFDRLCGIRSPLLTTSRLISIPLATKMFHFTRLVTCHLLSC